jgi:type III pantothenate kinase
MLLAIDIGNTNITLGVWDGRAWLRQWRLGTVHERTVDEYGIILKALLYDANAAIDQVIMSSVVPPLTGIFTAVSQQYLGRPALQVQPGLDTGIHIGTENPSQVGMDRVVNATAAYHIYPGPSIIVDMGTATKVDVVSAAGELIGGVIAPGLRVAADALISRAAQLSRVALEAPPQVLGRNTIHAVQSGLIYGYASLIEGLVRRLINEHPDAGQTISVIGTGGLIHLIAPHTGVIDHTDPWLTLTGLRLISERLQPERGVG